jgi:uncharacterized protein YqeY
MLDRINKDILQARKDRDKYKTIVLSTMKAELVANEKAKKPQDPLSVIMSYHKKLSKSFDVYRASITDLSSPLMSKLNDLKKEMAIVEEYIPKQATEDDIRNAFAEYVVEATEEGLNLNKGMAIKCLVSKLGKHNASNIAQFVNNSMK